jgi:CubicO group peptidase (beta-lactamase class C family)
MPIIKHITSKKYIPLLSILLMLIICSCENKYERITGYWEVSFSDSTTYPKQILQIRKEQGGIHMLIDEPSEGILGMPGEQVFFIDDSLHYESLWGFFKYDGSFTPGDSVIQGIRVVNNDNPSSFTMRKIKGKHLLYKIPRVDANEKRIYSYSYNKPEEKDDGFESAELSEAGIDSTFIYKLIENILKGRMARVHSLLLLKDDKLVLEEYFHTYDENKLHPIESVTKSFTSALTGIAIDRNYIRDVDDPVLNYLDKWNHTQWVMKKYDISIKNLLTMTAGLDWKAFTPNEYNDDMNIYLAPDYIEYILNKDLKDKPGERFFYNNRLMYLQGQVIETSTGISMDSFATRYLFDPLGIKDHIWKVYDNGVTETGGGLKLKPRDMMKFGSLYLNEGKWQDKQIVSSEWIKASTKTQIKAGNQGYGYNWWIKHYRMDNKFFEVYYALGHGEQTIMIIPEFNTVFVMTAGNFFQTPQRLDEIMTAYILPALNTN